MGLNAGVLLWRRGTAPRTPNNKTSRLDIAVLASASRGKSDLIATREIKLDTTLLQEMKGARRGATAR